MPTLPEELANRLGIPCDFEHLDQAMTHPSFSNEQRSGPRMDYQRLEFLGDAVLGMCVSELLVARFPDAQEGELSLMRASLVNTEALATWAREVGLGVALRLGRGADAAGDRDQASVLADAVEALVAAVYLDLGIERARELSRMVVEGELAGLSSGPRRDAKNELQERVQAEGLPSPRYRLLRSDGPDHRREFVVAVEVDGETVGEGQGRSKKAAERAAAQDAMARFDAERGEPTGD